MLFPSHSPKHGEGIHSLASLPLTSACSGYLEAHAPRLDADPVAVRHRCRHLGWAGVIAFPHLFASSFGEYGTAEVSAWACPGAL